MSKVIHLHKWLEAAETPPPPKGAQVENGYTRIANEILEAAMRAPLTSREGRVFHAVLRATFGWQRPTARLTQQVLAKMTGLTPKRCSEALSSLLRKRVLIREGSGRSPVGINTRVSEWTFKSETTRVTPKRRQPSERGQRPQDRVIERPQDGDTNKDRKDMNTPPCGGESTAGADDPQSGSTDHDPETQAEGAPSLRLPNCPHQAILDQWAAIMPEKRQPLRSLWAKGTGGSRDLAARWKQGFGILNEQTGEPLYSDEASGIDWWGRFFRFLRRSEFLMRDDSRFFGLDWVCKADNFRKIMELKYHGDLAQGDGGEA